jgi:hypothetical protein
MPPVEFLDSPVQPERTLLDQVQQGDTAASVVLGDRADKTQVRLDHPSLRIAVAALDPLGERDLLCGG